MLKRFLNVRFITVLALAGILLLSTFFPTSASAESLTNSSTPSSSAPSSSTPIFSTPSLSTNQTITPMGAGEWDKIFDDDVLLYPGVGRTTKTAESYGGDFAFRIDGNYAGVPLTIHLYESDGEGDFDEVRTPREVSAAPQWVIWRDISNWVDGSNNRAEFFVTIVAQGGDGNEPLYYTFFD